MKVYVDELPKRCLDCKFYDTFDLEKEDDVIYFKTYCQLIDEEILDGCEVCKNCPLKLIADYTKQVRKEVVKEIKQKLVQMGRWDIQENGSIYFKMNINTLNDILDKFEQEE